MMDFFSVNTIWLHIPLGSNGYDLSYIEAIGTICGLLCIWLASLEKNINYLFGIINVILFAVIFYQINLYASLLLQIYFLVANIYGWYAWSKTNEQQQAELQVRWLSFMPLIAYSIICIVAIIILTYKIDEIFGWLAILTVHILHAIGLQITLPPLAPDAYPFLDAVMTVL